MTLIKNFIHIESGERVFIPQHKVKFSKDGSKRYYNVNGDELVGYKPILRTFSGAPNIGLGRIDRALKTQEKLKEISDKNYNKKEALKNELRQTQA